MNRRHRILAGRKHSGRLAPKKVLRIRLSEGISTPLKKKDCVIVIDGQRFEGTTDNNGMLEIVLPDMKAKGHILFDYLKIPIVIDTIEPVSTTKGVQTRLNNLGFEVGRVDGKWGKRTQAGIRAFQRATKVAGSNTQSKLKDVHGS